MSNIVPACWRCNSRKGTKTLEEFRAEFDEIIGCGAFWWVEHAIEDLAELNWFCRGDAEDALHLFVRRLANDIKARRVVFYGECIGSEPNNYAI